MIWKGKNEIKNRKITMPKRISETMYGTIQMEKITEEMKNIFAPTGEQKKPITREIITKGMQRHSQYYKNGCNGSGDTRFFWMHSRYRNSNASFLGNQYLLSHTHTNERQWVKENFSNRITLLTLFKSKN